MQRQYHSTLPDTHLCDHGAPKHLTTSEGTPRCALCRAEARRRPVIDPNAVDAASLAARDDLWNDDNNDTPGPETGALMLAALFAHDSGNRVSRMLGQWREQPEPEAAGILF
jgi:hypothetical protein